MGTARTLGVTTTTVPSQPSTVTGSTSPCLSSSQTYSVTNVAGVTYNWSFPAGWTQTGGGTSNSVTVTVGANNGTITVTPSNSCGNGTARTLGVTTTTVPAQPSAITGGATPCIGSSQGYSVTNVAGVTYTWVLPAGWTKTGGGTTNSITVTVGANACTISVTPSNACGNGTARTLAVTVSPLPSAFNVTGTGSYCSGGSGVPIGLDGSQSGVNYQLKNGAANVGGPVAGNGSAISFGNQTTATTYTVIATNATTGCQNIMNGSATITINALPPAPTITPASATICQGTIQQLFSGTSNSATAQAISGNINLTIPNNNSGGVVNTLAIAGIPAGTTINSITVNFNINEDLDGDLIINLKAPSNKVLNLVYQPR